MATDPPTRASRPRTTMLLPTILMAVLAVVLVLLGYYRGTGQHLTGLKLGWQLTASSLPLILCAFVVAGMVQALVPKEAIAGWVGGESGWRGLLIGTLAGDCAPGGPYVSLPIVAVLIRSGTGVGTIVAFMTGWSLWAFGRLPMEVGILGWQLTLIRLAATFLFPPIAGIIAQVIATAVRYTP